MDNVKLGLLAMQIMAKHENIHLTRTPLKTHGFVIMYPLGFWRENQMKEQVTLSSWVQLGSVNELVNREVCALGQVIGVCNPYY